MFLGRRVVVAALMVLAPMVMVVEPALAGSGGPIPPTPVPGTAYVVDGETHTLWAIPPGGGERVAVADISSPAINDPNCSDNYQWGAAVLGAYVYWPDNNCGGIFRTSVVTGQTTEVMAAGYDGAYTYGYITADPFGNLWATAENSMLVEIPSTGGSPIVYDTTGLTFGSGSGIAWAQGYLYVEGNTIQRFADVPSTIQSATIQLTSYATLPSPLQDAWSYHGFTADAAGNLYLSDYNQIYVVSAATQATTLLPQSCTNHGIENLTFWSGNLYFSSWDPGYVCEFSSNFASASVYSTTANPTLDNYYTSSSGWNSPQFNPEGFGFYTSSGVTMRPLNLSVTQTGTTVTATWSNTGTFTCTLMYGFMTPSTFTTHVNATTCSFTNVSATTPWGIRVSALGGGSATGFGVLTRTTITCVRDGRIRHVTGVDPRCPSGWRQR